MSPLLRRRAGKKPLPGTAPVQLGQGTLDQLPAEVPRPHYERKALRTGIVHVGVGSFHRAHQAMYVDRLLSAGIARDWAICGVGVLPDDARMGVSRRQFFQTAAGMAASFVALNQVFGHLFDVSEAEAATHTAVPSGRT